MPNKNKVPEKEGDSSSGTAVTETKNPVPGGFNEETFQLKATNGRKFPTNIISRILFHDATKRLSTTFFVFTWCMSFNV